MSITIKQRVLELVRLLASAHAARPGYRPEWAPTSSGEQEQP